jgi:acetate kinase
MIVLVLNCGSSSLKFQVIDTTPDAMAAGEACRLARGWIERIGPDARLRFEAANATGVEERGDVPDHDAAVRQALRWMSTGRLLQRVDAIGHRVVHGGDHFTHSMVVDDAIAAGIAAVGDLAPLHNAPSVAGIQACRRQLGPQVPMVAVFDTTFHVTLPEHAYRYAIPYELSRRHRIRRYGFHGTSYRSVLSRYCRATGTAPEAATLVALHLGNGCSAAAIRHGRSVDTSMGFTPLEGLMMGTRAGDLDPALIAYLAERESVSAVEVERWLNERSGLLGVSGWSHDMRELLAREGHDVRARLAIDMFCYRARKYVGAYLAALGGAETVVFTGGIGENSPDVRARIAEGLDWFGLVLDAGRNASAIGQEGKISAETARVQAWVIPTDEELVIAQDVIACLTPGWVEKGGPA